MVIDEERMEFARVWGFILLFAGLGFHWLMYPYSSEALIGLQRWAVHNNLNLLNQLLYWAFVWPPRMMSHVILFILEVLFVVYSIKLLIGTFRFFKGSPKTSTNGDETVKLPLKERIRKFVIKFILYLVGGVTGIAAVVAIVAASVFWGHNTLYQNPHDVIAEIKTVVKERKIGESQLTWPNDEPALITNRKADGKNFIMTVQVTDQDTCEQIFGGFINFFKPLEDDFMYVYTLKAGEIFYKVDGLKPEDKPSSKERAVHCKSIVGDKTPIEVLYDPD